VGRKEAFKRGATLTVSEKFKQGREAMYEELERFLFLMVRKKGGASTTRTDGKHKGGTETLSTFSTR